ncbi:MAG: ribosome modulation factor [Proteobacteria bacterium]|nr:ribosome modulation factor [Pseudomonadota bacterium]MDA1301670.1 ribosome modulation factor [Pseudomonadota bacterium]
MRRQKRDRTDRAFTRGYQTGQLRKSKDLCPYHTEESRSAWLNGWRTGREDSWDGYVGTAGVSHQPQP